MCKKVCTAAFVFLLIFANSAFAHTGMESSSPEKGQTIKQELKQITLTFETKIEQGSSLKVTGEDGSVVEVADIEVNGKQLIGNLAAPLANGGYEVNWSIIGADGHHMDGDYSFTVEVPGGETTAKDPAETEDSQSNDVKAPDEENGLPSYVIPLIIVVLVVIAGGTFVAITRRKK